MNAMREVEFDCGDDGVKAMAIFCAQLTREGITFRVTDKGTRYIVCLLGF